jgi:hypothetical protein
MVLGYFNINIYSLSRRADNHIPQVIAVNQNRAFRHYMVICSCGTLAFTMLVIVQEHTNMGWERTLTNKHALKPYRMMIVTELDPNVVLQLLTSVA